MSAPDLQQKMIPLFHYALRRGGYLFLGPSENVTAHGGLFRAVDKKHRIFQRKESLPRPVVQFPLADIAQPPARGAGKRPRGRTKSPEAAGAHHPAAIPARLRHRQGKRRCRLFLGTGQPLSRTADRQPRHQCGEYGAGGIPRSAAQRPAPGGELARTGPDARFRFDAAADVHRHRRATRRVPGRRSLHDHVRGGGLRRRPSRAQAFAPGAEETIRHLENELRAAQEHSQATLEELETTNEELQSANEEFQSTNEELETSKEELQSFNEELETVNAELNRKVAELDSANSDLQNLLNSTQIATIFLDLELHIKNFTPAAGAVFRLIPGDIGRPITDLAAQFAESDLGEDIREVLRTLEMRERQLTAPRGQHYQMRILPYRTVNNVIEGVVITFLDVTQDQGGGAARPGGAGLCREHRRNGARAAAGAGRRPAREIGEQSVLRDLSGF